MCWIWMLLYFNIPAPCSDSNSDESLTRNKRIPKPAATFLVHPSDVKPTEDITNLPELSTRNLADYIGTLTDNTPENALQGLKFLAEYGIIENDRTCVKCLSGMNLNQDSKIIHDKHVWRCLPCRRNKESSKISMRAGSFFENLKLTVVEVFYLAAEWIENPSKTVAEVSKQFGISHTTVVEVQEWFRQMTKQWFKRESEANPNMKLGGPGKIVEIDETCVYRAKHHRGRMLRRKTKWVFGMIERGSSKVVMFRVPNRSAATLLPIVAKYVEPGSKIISDGWAAYTGLSAMQFDHHWVNHKINFVDPNDRTIHTQTIESTWNALKTQLKARYGTPEERLDGHMYNYMWRRYYNKQKLLNRLIYEMKFYKRKSREEDDNEEFTDSEEDDDDDIDDDDDDDDDNINDSTMIAQPTSDISDDDSKTFPPGTPFVTSTVSHLPYSATPHRRRGHHKSTPQPARISSTLATDDAASPSSIPSTNTPSTTPVFTSTTFTPFSTSSRRRGHRSSTTPTASTYPSTNMAASPSPAVTPSTAESPVVTTSSSPLLTTKKRRGHRTSAVPSVTTSFSTTPSLSSSTFSLPPTSATTLSTSNLLSPTTRRSGYRSSTVSTPTITTRLSFISTPTVSSTAFTATTTASTFTAPLSSTATSKVTPTATTPSQTTTIKRGGRRTSKMSSTTPFSSTTFTKTARVKPTKTPSYTTKKPQSKLTTTTKNSIIHSPTNPPTRSRHVTTRRPTTTKKTKTSSSGFKSPTTPKPPKIPKMPKAPKVQTGKGG